MSSGALGRRVGELAGWAARTGYSVTNRLPGVATAERGLRSIERTALRELRRRMDEADAPYLAALGKAGRRDAEGRATGATGSSMGGAVPAVAGRVDPLRAAMAELLGRSVTFSGLDARDYLYALLLRGLTPDEARILAVLADGTPFPVIDVAERSGLTGTGKVLLRNASTVGTAAGVSLLDHVPTYVDRMVAFGLARIGGEDPALGTGYEVLATDDLVRVALRAARKPRLVRRTVEISEFGARFWRACSPAGVAPLV
jgi:hypothetical protein